jgi:hypothetical protein
LPEPRSQDLFGGHTLRELELDREVQVGLTERPDLLFQRMETIHRSGKRTRHSVVEPVGRFGRLENVKNNQFRLVVSRECACDLKCDVRVLQEIGWVQYRSDRVHDDGPRSGIQRVELFWDRMRVRPFHAALLIDGGGLNDGGDPDLDAVLDNLALSHESRAADQVESREMSSWRWSSPDPRLDVSTC